MRGGESLTELLQLDLGLYARLLHLRVVLTGRLRQTRLGRRDLLGKAATLRLCGAKGSLSLRQVLLQVLYSLLQTGYLIVLDSGLQLCVRRNMLSVRNSSWDGGRPTDLVRDRGRLVRGNGVVELENLLLGFFQQLPEMVVFIFECLTKLFFVSRAIREGVLNNNRMKKAISSSCLALGATLGTGGA